MNDYKRTHQQPSISQAGFSLIEILIVIALLGTLAAITIAKLDTVLGDGKKDAAKLFVNQMKLPLQRYNIHMNDYPSSAEGLDALLKAPSGAGSRWRGPYLEEDPKDPWEQPYEYKYPGTRSSKPYDVWSKGPDKKNGTSDDIGNWE